MKSVFCKLMVALQRQFLSFDHCAVVIENINISGKWVKVMHELSILFLQLSYKSYGFTHL